MILWLWACFGLTGVESEAPDSAVPESVAPEVCYADEDLDGYGAAQAPCGPATAGRKGDCDDGDAAVFPKAPESCNGIDDDCDGQLDDEDPERVDGLPFWADGDGDGFGGTEIKIACILDYGMAVLDGDCDDSDPSAYPGAPEACDGIDRNCDGSGASSLGSGYGCPAASCAEILSVFPSATDGPWWLVLPSGTVQPQYCDMQTDGGGWTLAFLRNSASTGSQGDFGLGELSPEQLSVSPAEASSSSTPILSWIDLNEFPYSELRLVTAARGVETWTSSSIRHSQLRISFGDNGYYLHGEAGYYWCGGDASYTDAGIGAVNNPPQAPADCKGHGSLGSGWDFSEAPTANAGLTLCGGDASAWLYGNYGSDLFYYGSAGGAQGIWVR